MVIGGITNGQRSAGTFYIIVLWPAIYSIIQGKGQAPFLTYFRDEKLI